MSRVPLVLAIDQGTTNTKAQVIAHSGAIVAQAAKPVPIVFPRQGWVEQDPLAIWRSVIEAANECLEAAPAREIVAVGLSNQRESVLVWDRRSGEPLGPCITWQCRRTAPLCDELRAQGLEDELRSLTGLPIDPLFSASKAAWLLDQIDPGRERAAQGELCVGTVDSWLIWQLTGGSRHLTDATNASRTQLLNLRSVQWDDRLLEVFRVPRACLPDIRASGDDFGRTSARSGLPDGVPIAGAIGDSHAALFGHAAFAPGATKATYGTGSSLMTTLAAVPVDSTHGLASTIAWARDGRVTYALEGNITNTGGAVQWLGECLCLQDPVEDVVRLAGTVTDSGGVQMVPAFAGLGAPYWDADARGAIVGLTRGSNAGHLAYAVLDAIAHQVCDVFEAMVSGSSDASRGSSIPKRLMAGGGASRNTQLMQRQADLLGYPVECDASADVSLRGAAWLAGLSVGFWDSLETLEHQFRDIVTFHPAMNADARAAARADWHDAVSRVRSRR